MDWLSVSLSVHTQLAITTHAAIYKARAMICKRHNQSEVLPSLTSLEPLPGNVPKTKRQFTPHPASWLFLLFCPQAVINCLIKGLSPATAASSSLSTPMHSGSMGYAPAGSPGMAGTKMIPDHVPYSDPGSSFGGGGGGGGTGREGEEGSGMQVKVLDGG